MDTTEIRCRWSVSQVIDFEDSARDEIERLCDEVDRLHEEAARLYRETDRLEASANFLLKTVNRVLLSRGQPSMNVSSVLTKLIRSGNSGE